MLLVTLVAASNVQDSVRTATSNPSQSILHYYYTTANTARNATATAASTSTSVQHAQDILDSRPQKAGLAVGLWHVSHGLVLR